RSSALCVDFLSDILPLLTKLQAPPLICGIEADSPCLMINAKRHGYIEHTLNGRAVTTEVEG
ncbi:3181_t:CDS:1, partial [Acaulospora morrowiae]